MAPLSSVQTYELSARQSLLAILPSPDEILRVLSENNKWWDSFQKKIVALSGASDIEPLESFAARVMKNAGAAELATLAIGYERSLNQDYSRLPVIERLILSSFDILCTIHGLECLILLGKTYTDIGKPRRAWLTWRKGLAAAQLLVRLTHNSHTLHICVL